MGRLALTPHGADVSQSRLGRRFIAVAIVMLVVGLPATAGAATIARTANTLTYYAAEGEENRLTITFDGVVGYVFEDTGTAPGGPVAIQGACGSATGLVRCVPFVSEIDVNLGDLNDGLTVSLPADHVFPVAADGGDGSDVLSGGAAGDDLHGGAGADLLSGGGGEDRLDSGASPGGTGTDVLVGGDGIDTVDYSQRTTPQTMSLDGVANDGEAGEDDNIGSDVEHLVGGSQGDTIVGGAASDILEGRDGDDRIAASPGDDMLSGGDGDDNVDGGAGDDAIRGDLGADTLAGGDGRDFVSGGGGSDVIQAQVATTSQKVPTAQMIWTEAMAQTTCPAATAQTPSTAATVGTCSSVGQTPIFSTVTPAGTA